MKIVTPEEIFGTAIQDYYRTGHPQNITTETDISAEDDLPVDYLFRTFEDMPAVEQQALQLAEGKVLDVGCGAGSHALYLQTAGGLEVIALDSSAKSLDVAASRGVKRTVASPLLTWNAEEKFDTVLLLMNGTGIFEQLQKLDTYLQKLKSVLTPTGCILVDGTDILYMYDQDEDGGHFIPADRYYGEVLYKMTYKNLTTDYFYWLYLDYPTLSRAARQNGFTCQLVTTEEASYLAKLTLSP